MTFTGSGNGLLLPSLLTWGLGSLTLLALSGAISGLSTALFARGVLAVAAAVAVRLLRPPRAADTALALT